jgi:phenylalanyl-tRNA synthetase alpha chain
MTELVAIVRALSDIEKQCLKAMQEGKNYSMAEIAGIANMHIDSARRASAWLVQKGLVLENKKKSKSLQLTQEGMGAKEAGLPERKMLNVLLKEDKLPFSELKWAAKLNEQEFQIALGLNRKNAFVMIIKDDKGPVAEITEVGKEIGKEKTEIEQAFRNVSEGIDAQKNLVDELKKRGLVEEKEFSEMSISITADGLQAREMKEFLGEREYNIYDPVPKIYIGKKQPYVQFLNSIRKKLVALGFKEMPERLVNQEFYNFDVLFQPQNHPARTWTDTYQLKKPSKGRLPSKEKVDAIRKAHEFGGKTGSKGWGYKWSEEIATRLMPTAHGTAADARQMVEGVEFPRKYFVINRCFRPDVLDATHLIEFNQLDGFIVGEGLSFRNLLGILEDFAREIAGAKDVRFYPDYYPFTEPSVQLSAKHPELGWVEFAGAGIFRPEITESLGIKGPVLAWGMGVDRLAMFKLGIKDIRLLFSDDLTWLRNSKMVIE